MSEVVVVVVTPVVGRAGGTKVAEALVDDDGDGVFVSMQVRVPQTRLLGQQPPPSEEAHVWEPAEQVAVSETVCVVVMVVVTTEI